MSHQLFRNTRFQRRKPTFGGQKQHLCAVQASTLDEAKPWFAWCKPHVWMKQAAAPHHPNPSGAPTQSYLTYFRSVKFRQFIFTNAPTTHQPPPAPPFQGDGASQPQPPGHTRPGLAPPPNPLPALSHFSQISPNSPLTS